MRLEPAAPFPNNQRSHFFLSHQRTPFEPVESSYACAGLVGSGGSILELWTSHVEGNSACRRADEHLRRLL
jgi:hypothetical protein